MKLESAVRKLISDVSGLSSRLDSMANIRAVVHNGKDGKDGISPDASEIADIVLAKIPVPASGRDGRDGVAPDASDIASVVLAKIPKPENGKDGKDGVSPSAEDVAILAADLIPVPMNGIDGGKGDRGDKGDRGSDGANGADGKDGVSITDVQLDKSNNLFVWMDGKRKKVGSIKLPKSKSAPFVGGGSGLGGASKLIDESVYKKPVRVDAALDIVAEDGDIFLIVGTGNTPATVSYPSATKSKIGVKIRSIGATVTNSAMAGDTVEVSTITDGQSIEHVPAINEWVKL